MAERPWLSVRARATLVGSLVVGVALALALVLAVRFLHSSLTGDVQQMAQARADAVAAQLARGGHLLTVVDLDDAEELVQVVSSDGAELGASSTARGLPLMHTLGQGAVQIRETNGDVGRYTLATAVMPSDAKAETMRGGTVVVGRDLSGTERVESQAMAALAVAVVLLLALLIVTLWWQIGRALRPVERMRARAEEISHSNLGLRLPEAGGDDEVARLSRTLNAMLGRLEQSATAQRRFVSDASHELRTPLTVVRQHAELVLHYPDRVDAAELARGTLAETDRMSHLVEGLLVLARSDEQRLTSAPEPVDLDDLVLDEASRLRAAGRVRVDGAGIGPVRVPGDRVRLARVVRNLADNAARHARSTVWFTCRMRNDLAVIDVDDDGAGVPPEHRTRVFERFVRLDEARDRDAGGSGLGLAIVRETVLAHGGQVEVLDAPGGGARFEVRLPLR